MQTATFGKHTVPTATATRWVRESDFLAAVAERDQAEGLLNAAERRVAELERECCRLRFLLDTTREPLPV